MKKIKDNRGLFILGEGSKYDQVFVATNTNKYTFRGLHYQIDPRQTKHISVIQGKVLDFLYDPNTKEVKEYILTPDSEILDIDKNYAHGYLTLEPNTILYYGVEGKFNPITYSSIVWSKVPQIENRILEIVGEDYHNKITISDKDKFGT